KTATDYFGGDARKQAEAAALADIVNGFDAGAPLYRELYQDYEQRASLEARLVKAADVIDLLVEVLALERAGARGLNEFWDVARNGDFQLEGPAQEMVAGVLRSLLEARAEIIASGK